MKFQFPKKRIEDTTWFLNQNDRLRYGVIKMISIAIKADECHVWYSILTEEQDTVVVSENQLIDNDLIVPSPKWHIGDCVNYNYTGKNKKIYNTDGIIARIEVHIYENKPEYCYFMEDDDDYWVMDSDICGFSERIIDMSKGIANSEEIIQLPSGSEGSI